MYKQITSINECGDTNVIHGNRSPYPFISLKRMLQNQKYMKHVSLIINTDTLISHKTWSVLKDILLLL